MTPFKLPDLVLGVSIVADTSGARKAARDLKRAVNQEMGKGTGGGGGFGGTFGGSLLGTMLGGGGGGGSVAAKAGSRHIVNMLAGANAGAGLKMGRWAQDKRLKLGKPASSAADVLPFYMAEGYRTYGHWKAAQRPRPIPRLPATNISGIRGSNYGAAQNTALWNKSLAAQSKTMAKSMATATKGMAKAAGGSLGKTALSTGMFAALSKGNITGMLLKFGKVFWPLLIVALIAALFVKVVVPAVKAAFGYIRNVGARGKYGEFGQTAAATPVLLRNAQVQFGLMAITLLNLNSVLENVNLGLMRLGTVFSFIADHPLGFKMAMMASGIGAFIVAVPYILDLLEFVTRWIPTTGGKDLGAGSSGKLGGAMLEGSVEAYSTIQGTMARYAAQTAKNTKESSDALKRILARGGDMGVVPG